MDRANWALSRDVSLSLSLYRFIRVVSVHFDGFWWSGIGWPWRPLGLGELGHRFRPRGWRRGGGGWGGRFFSFVLLFTFARVRGHRNVDEWRRRRLGHSFVLVRPDGRRREMFIVARTTGRSYSWTSRRIRCVCLLVFCCIFGGGGLRFTLPLEPLDSFAWTLRMDNSPIEVASWIQGPLLLEFSFGLIFIARFP